MKLIILDPLYQNLATEQNTADLKNSGFEVIVESEVRALKECGSLFEPGDKIVAINPDFVDWSLPKESFHDIPDLKAIITQSTSFGWIDTDYAKSRNIAVFNIRNFSTDAVADWAVLMMLNVARKIPLLVKNDFPLNFGSDFETYQGMNLKGKTAGIIGLGNIGTAIAERCSGLGMNVQYWNRSTKENGFKAVDVDTIFQSSDVVIPCLADSEETKKIITDEHLNMMHKNTMLISIVHKVFNEALAIEMAENGKIYGFGFEGKPESFKTYKGNIWAAPSYAWCTTETLKNSVNAFINVACDYVDGKFKNQVN